MVNQYTLRLMRQLLDLSEFDSIISQLSTVSDVELLLDFILDVRTTCLLELECLYHAFPHSATPQPYADQFRLPKCKSGGQKVVIQVDVNNDCLSKVSVYY